MYVEKGTKFIIKTDYYQKSEMYGILSVIFILIISFTHYQLSTNITSPFIINDITLSKQIVTNKYQIFSTCIDKQKLTPNPFMDMKIMSLHQLTFIVIFDSNPLLQCQQITYAMDFSQLDHKTDHIKFEKIIMLKALIGDTQIIKLQQQQYLQISNQKQFLLIITAKQKKQNTNFKLKDENEEIKVNLQMQNQSYLQQLLQCVFWFSWFNLIGISLISYYRKNVFNEKTLLLSSVTILLYLIWISFTTQPSYQTLQDQLKTIMLCFILLICIKLKLSLPETLLIVFLSLINQVIVDLEINSYIKWLIFIPNLFNLSTIFFGQNYEAAHFSIFSFLIQYGLQNPYINIINPIPLNLIFVNLIFGPTIYELLQLRQDVTIQTKKTQQRLQSYEISEHDHLFVN